jgi:prepilin-type N-terminal cleavage/methylation domain-containing protein
MKTHEKNHQAGVTLIEFIVALVVAAIIASMVYTYFGSAFTQSSVPIARLQQVSKLQQVMENIVADYNRLNKINLRYKWRSGSLYSIGAIVLPSDLPNDNINSKIDNNGRYYICTTAGTSGTAMIRSSWPVTVDPTGTAVLTGTITEAGTGRPTWQEGGRVWQPSVSYAVGTIVVPINNNGHFYKCTTAGTSGATEPIWPRVSGSPVTETGTGRPTWTEVGTILARSDPTTPSNPVLDDNIYKHLMTSNGIRYGTGYTVVTADTKFIKFVGASEDLNPLNSNDEKNIFKVTIKNNDSAETLTQWFTIL